MAMRSLELLRVVAVKPTILETPAAVIEVFGKQPEDLRPTRHRMSNGGEIRLDSFQVEGVD